MRETGSTSELALALGGRLTGRRVAAGFLSSLLLCAASPRLAQAAGELEVRLDGMALPISIDDLSAWVRSGGERSSELGVWFNLLEEQSRSGVIDLLQAPLINDSSMTRQILKSWAGRQLLDQVGDLVQVDDETTGLTVQTTLEQLLEQRPEVTTLELLEALPAKKVRLDLDALLEVAASWRLQLERQQLLVERLGRQPVSLQRLKQSTESAASADGSLERLALPVPHRERALQLQLWLPEASMERERRSWLVLMPGLGGSPDHFGWLGRALSRNGWPVVVLEHPGSDAVAVQALLEGRRPPPGAEVLPERLRDLQEVLLAQERGELPLSGDQLVLVGHSLGALTALLASGAQPEPGLGRRCKKVMDDLPLSNLSRLLQCQIQDVALPASTPPASLAGVVGLNSFGSLLWPRRLPVASDIPVLLSGGSLDLITPPLSEQLGLLRALPSNPGTRAVLVEGASHFSPVRVEGQRGGEGEDLFQLGEEFVGVQPLQVQALLEQEILRFLEALETGRRVTTADADAEHVQVGALHLYRLNQAGAARLLD
ncbi:alpha/beta hydrolase [Synechococcus sp. PROS-7-1]|uniref:alpha/beta hydrolase n=1 Tax=Synechococcus sp. PROS-7-1 TaxID=1442556 RepID=UPI001648FD84|nr:alpha/beta hydrolase [Synechococcus sp. PROS-7-1]QNI85617.1 alpha/beta hydrolase [Synechococcus sp. PROS-7-1]